jgi:hypothetical protein
MGADTHALSCHGECRNTREMLAPSVGELPVIVIAKPTSSAAVVTTRNFSRQSGSKPFPYTKRISQPLLAARWIRPGKA